MKAVKLKNRQGFTTMGMRWVYRFLYFFFHCRLFFPSDWKADDEEPVVFVANHYNVFGPISFILSLPFPTSVWINQYMIDPDQVKKGMMPGIQSALPFLPEKAVDWLCEQLGKLSCRWLVRFGVIPVDRDNPSTLMRTMRQSVAALEEGNNVIIFPETGFPEYSLTSVTPFFSGFATVGAVYHRKTGKDLRFRPCYIDEQHHVIRIGEIVTYRAEGSAITAESERVSDELNDTIRAMAAASHGEQREKGTPGRRTILFFCNLLRIALLIPLIALLADSDPGNAVIFYTISQCLRVLFNAIFTGSFAASNRGSILFSHALGIITDGCVLVYLWSLQESFGWLLLAVLLNAICILVSNIMTWFRKRRFAGVNYFDTLSANVLCILCLQQLMSIHLSRLVLSALRMAAYIFLGCSAGFSVAFNLRIDSEKDETLPANA